VRVLPELAAVVAELEKIAEVSVELVLSCNRTFWPDVRSRVTTLTLVGVTFPHHTLLAKIAPAEVVVVVVVWASAVTAAKPSAIAR
jgi:hypothetical protein